MIRSLFLTVSLASCAAVSAQELTSSALLEKMNKAYSSVKSAKFSVEGKGYVRDATTKMDVVFAAPHKIRATVTGLFGEGSKTIFTTTGDKVTIVDAEGKMEKREVDFDQMRLTGNLETLCFWDHKAQLSASDGGNMQGSTLKVIAKESWNGKDWIVLEEDAPQVGVEVRYFIDPKTYLIWRTLTKSKDGGNTTESWITKLELDPKVSDKDFTG